MEPPDPDAVTPVIPAARARPTSPTSPTSRTGPTCTAGSDAPQSPGDPSASPPPQSARPPGAAAPTMFLTANEVGQQLGIRKSRVYELAAAGLLPVVRLGRRMRFPRRGLEELAAAAIERAKTEVLGAGGPPVGAALRAALRRHASYSRGGTRDTRNGRREVA